jgi:hypothetical protein
MHLKNPKKLFQCVVFLFHIATCCFKISTILVIPIIGKNDTSMGGGRGGWEDR